MQILYPKTTATLLRNISHGWLESPQFFSIKTYIFVFVEHYPIWPCELFVQIENLSNFHAVDVSRVDTGSKPMGHGCLHGKFGECFFSRSLEVEGPTSDIRHVLFKGISRYS